MAFSNRILDKMRMLALAWFISLLFSIPQAVLYNTSNPDHREECKPDFAKEWGVKVTTKFFN